MPAILQWCCYFAVPNYVKFGTLKFQVQLQPHRRCNDIYKKQTSRRTHWAKYAASTYSNKPQTEWRLASPTVSCFTSSCIKCLYNSKTINSIAVPEYIIEALQPNAVKVDVKTCCLCCTERSYVRTMQAKEMFQSNLRRLPTFQCPCFPGTGLGHPCMSSSRSCQNTDRGLQRSNTLWDTQSHHHMRGLR